MNFCAAVSLSHEFDFAIFQFLLLVFHEIPMKTNTMRLMGVHRAVEIICFTFR